MSFTRHISPSLALVQPRKTRSDITDNMLNATLKSNDTNTYQISIDSFIMLMHIIGVSIL